MRIKKAITKDKISRYSNKFSLLVPYEMYGEQKGLKRFRSSKEPGNKDKPHAYVAKSGFTSHEVNQNYNSIYFRMIQRTSQMQ